MVVVFKSFRVCSCQSRSIIATSPESTFCWTISPVDDGIGCDGGARTLDRERPLGRDKFNGRLELSFNDAIASSCNEHQHMPKPYGANVLLKVSRLDSPFSSYRHHDHLFSQSDQIQSFVSRRLKMVFSYPPRRRPFLLTPRSLCYPPCLFCPAWPSSLYPPYHPYSFPILQDTFHPYSLLLHPFPITYSMPFPPLVLPSFFVFSRPYFSPISQPNVHRQTVAIPHRYEYARRSLQSRMSHPLHRYLGREERIEVQWQVKDLGVWKDRISFWHHHPRLQPREKKRWKMLDGWIRQN